MNILVHHCPVGATPFSVLLEHTHRSFFVIKKEDSKVYAALKHVGNSAHTAVIAIALCIAALVSPILFLTDGIIHLGRKLGCKFRCIYYNDFHYFFTSNLFRNYLHKLKEYVTPDASQPFPKKVSQFIQLILNAQSCSNEKINRSLHQKIVTGLRDLNRDIQKLSPGDNSVKFIEKLNEFVYVGTRMLPDISSFFDSQIPACDLDDLDKIPSSTIPEWIGKCHARLGNQIRFNGVFEYPRLYDPRHLGDAPTILFDYSLNNKQIKVIRTPAVVTDSHRNEKGIVDQAEIVNEFRGFLESYKKQNKVHLYVNLMERMGNSEATRSQLLENLEQEFPNTISVITLAKNSDFYLQRGKHNKSLQDYSEFKKNFSEEMFSNTFRWSNFLLSHDWGKICLETLDTVHNKFFQRKSSLNISERRDFIEIAYVELIEKSFELIQPDSCNVSCKSCIDRAPAVLAQLYLKNCLKENSELDSKQRKEIVAITLAPALFAQNRVMQSDRMSRLQTVSKRMLQSK